MLNINNIKREYKTNLDIKIRKQHSQIKDFDTHLKKISNIPEEERTTNDTYRLNTILSEKDACVQQLKINEDKMLNINNGIIIDDIIDYKNKKEKEIENKTKHSLQKRNDKKQTYKDNKQKINSFFTEQKQINKDNRGIKYNKKKAIQHYLNAYNTLPTNIKNKLSKMNNNNGIQWKYSTFFGIQDKTSDTINIQEKKYTKYYTHLFQKKKYSLFENKKYNKKQVSTKKRDNKLLPINLMDWVTS